MGTISSDRGGIRVVCDGCGAHKVLHPHELGDNGFACTVCGRWARFPVADRERARRGRDFRSSDGSQV